jgi:hypothetical protein
MFIVTDEQKACLEEEIVKVKMQINKYHWETLRGISKEVKMSMAAVTNSAINFFLNHYWSANLDRKMEEIYKDVYAKEFMIDYFKYLIESSDLDDETSLLYFAKKCYHRKNYKKHRDRNIAYKKGKYYEDVEETRQKQRDYKAKKKAESLASTGVGSEPEFIEEYASYVPKKKRALGKIDKKIPPDL